MVAWSEAINHLDFRVGVVDLPPDHGLNISRAQEQLKENAWGTNPSRWHLGQRLRL